VTFYWTRRYFGATAAVIAAALFTLIPPVLAHAGLATTDMALTACLGLAFFLLVRWAEEPLGTRAALAGLGCGLAALSKFTALGFLPAGVMLALVAYLAVERPSIAKMMQLAKERAAGFGLIAAVAALAIWAAYLFSWNHGPAPEFFDGIQVALKHNENGHPAWLLGEQSNTGWWYYFPVAIAVKTPLALLLLWFFGLWLCWKNRRRVAWLLPAAFVLGVILPAMQGRVNIGVRHILPLYIAVCVTAAAGVEELLRKRSIVPALLAGWLVVSGALHHPDYIPYFNELVQGQPDHVLVDSDYDWGQDTKRLATRLRELGVTEVNYGWVDSPDNHFLETYPGLPHIVNIHPLKPAGGWTAVRPTLERISQYGLQYRYPNLQPWYMFLTPREHVGTIWLYYVPPGSVPLAK
jgi:4-amino-4-deoxy-L-arabinose transferase-like glycosyltransferase